MPKKFTIRGRSESSIREQLETVGLESDGVINSTMGGKKRNRYATLLEHFQSLVSSVIIVYAS